MSAAAYIMPALVTIFFWWFATGLVISVYGRDRQMVARFFAAASGLAVCAIGGVWLLRDSITLPAVYGSLICGIALWGWQTASYYLGFIKGPVQQQVGLTPQTSWARFWMALQDSLYHELVALLAAVLLAVMTWHSPNRWALIIYCALWLMHSSAKLNVFLGVRNFRIEFLPEHVHHLGDLLGKRTSNWLLPLSLLVSLGAAGQLFYLSAISTSEVQIAGLISVGTMLLLGALEHGLLVLPLSMVQWGWGLRKLPPLPAAASVTEKTHERPPMHLPLRPASEAAGD